MSTPPAPRPRAEQSLTRVQQFVMSTLAVTTILHFVGGLIVVVWFMDESRVVSRVGLLVIAGSSGFLCRRVLLGPTFIEVRWLERRVPPFHGVRAGTGGLFAASEPSYLGVGRVPAGP